MNILLISSSQSRVSYSYYLANLIRDKLDNENFFTEIWNLKEKPLSVLIPELHKNIYANTDTDILDFIKKVNDSQIIILVTPVHHGSYSGHLKIALDQLNKDAFKHKFVGIVSHGHNILKSALPATHLRTVIASMGGYSLCTEIATSMEDYDCNKESKISLKKNIINSRIDKLINEIKERNE